MKKMSPDEILNAVKEFIDEDIDLSYKVSIMVNGKESGVSYQRYLYEEKVSDDVRQNCDNALIQSIADSLKKQINNNKFKETKEE